MMRKQFSDLCRRDRYESEEWFTTNDGFRNGAQWRYYGKFSLNIGLKGLNFSG